MRPLHRLALPGLLVTSVVLTGCAEKVDSDDPRAVTVSSSADACEVSKTEVPAGTVSFEVTNTGDAVTEFYVLAEDGLQILGEVENIGRDLSRTLTVQLPEGSYVTACKPGMKGDGIRDDFAVKASDEKVEVSADEQELIDTATTNYRAYVQDQADQLLAKTTKFVELYEAGKDDEARALYPVARTHWERIEPVAESFGDLDPAMDLREADVEEGAEWTGWHRIEKDLWPARAKGYTPLTDAERATYAQDLLANTEKLDGLVDADDFSLTVDQVANGSTGLLEEVAAGKVTGEEEYWSRTDLYDFQANLDGARVAFEGVRPILETKDADLATTLDARFTALEEMLGAYREGDGFVGYDELTQDQVKQLKDGVDALSEPLSTLAAAVLA